MNIGLIGCGAMGQGIARNLLKADYKVFIHDDMSKAKESLEAEGVQFVDIKTLSEQVEYLFLSLPSTEILQEAMLGEEGVVKNLSVGGIVFDMGTTDVEVTQQIYKEAEAAGIHYLDCPVSGGPAGAAAGTLTIVVGGDKSAFESAKYLLEVVGENIVYVGSSGTGQVVKLCNNMLVAGITSLLSETMMIANDHGVSSDTLAEIIQQSSGQNKVLDVFGENLIQKDFSHILFYLEHMAKDIELYMNLSKESKKPQYVSSIVNQLYRTAIQQGKGRQDSTAVYSIISN